jgi:signal transduction histidine kinase
MRSILLTILLWSAATIALCVAGIWVTFRALDRSQGRGVDPVKSLINMVEDDTRRAFDEGGPGGLSAHLRRLDTKLPGERFLTDATGRDLVDDADRSKLLSLSGPGFGRLHDGQFAIITKPRDGRYRFIWITEPWFSFPGPAPLIAVVGTIIAVMGTALAVYLSSPLRRLRHVMNRFGMGDLRARVGTRRRDEIGVVSREFDLLAERVEMLVTAERRLLQDVSHELRSPLTRLDVAVDLAIKREDRGALLERIRRDVARLSALVGELLHLTRAEGDPLARVLEPVRPAELLRELVEDCSIEAEAKGCRMELRAEWPDAIRADPELLRRAFENVMRNAIRHAPEGTPVEVSLETCGQGVKVVVRDYGPGVPMGALSSIFEPFFRVEEDRSRNSGGVGLGLAIARRAVAIHDGQITARNVEPGLCVEVVLPGSWRADPAPAPRAANGRASRLLRNWRTS